MQVIIKENYDEMSLEAAKIIRDAIHLKPNLVLGLATGSTPIGTYKELIRMYKSGELDFSKAVTFNLDEYVSLPPTHKQSYHYFMHYNLFDHININPANVHVPS
ncbi:glucosamine-6-phosphate deaminase, partial [Candidatus Poribacteria bacterium]|nr:glucosamine-6-phosphate deaminase [Candidatus Poribacteria bacterium]